MSEKASDRDPSAVANLEQDIGNALLGEKKTSGLGSLNGGERMSRGEDIRADYSELSEADKAETEAQEKECSRCGLVLPITRFYRNKKGKNGRRSKCSKCCNEETRLWRQSLDKDEMRRKKKEWEKKNPKSYFLSRARRLAKLTGSPFDLSREDIEIPERCPLLGVLIDYDEKGTKADNSPSVDRIIPELGYVKGNVKIISELANRIKTNATPDQIKDLAGRIDEYSESALSLSTEEAG